MSPVGFTDGSAGVRLVSSDGGGYSGDSVYLMCGVRPTLNLIPDILKFGDGTMDNPYRMTE